MIFSEKHELVRKLARDFAEKELTKDVLDQIEETDNYPKELLDKMAKAGFYGIKTPVQYGGQGSDYLSYVITIEELARASAVTTIWASAPNSLGGGPLLLAGTPEQLEKYLKPVARGEKNHGLRPHRAQRRLRRRRHDDDGRPRRRLLDSERPQDVHHHGACGRLVHHLRQDRPQPEGFQGHLGFYHGYEAARRSPAANPSTRWASSAVPPPTSSWRTSASTMTTCWEKRARALQTP